MSRARHVETCPERFSIVFPQSWEFTKRRVGSGQLPSVSSEACACLLRSASSSSLCAVSDGDREKEICRVGSFPRMISFVGTGSDRAPYLEILASVVRSRLQSID
ncbi:hypothetical protein CDAR_520261 [Caerostris darwini]|uniref:Uncharacterized protein n=1 Tax=Caerostris darwini TaxID=1538125 RepID=A0AAV4TF34_9ARAC|nr:hypothetical protein CDAR_520261 [Caerostris darwini]